MFKYIDRYIDWTLDLKPSWVGLVMFLLLILCVTVVGLPLGLLLLVLTNGWILLAIPAFLVYAVYLALNQ
jgi:flagellar biosynthesis protein FliP